MNLPILSSEGNLAIYLQEIKKFPNPIGRTLESWKRKNKLNIKKVTTPIGVIGIIYESRPNVTADVAALFKVICVKSLLTDDINVFAGNAPPTENTI